MIEKESSAFFSPAKGTTKQLPWKKNLQRAKIKHVAPMYSRTLTTTKQLSWKQNLHGVKWLK